jgi:hypothetical protein
LNSQRVARATAEWARDYRFVAELRAVRGWVTEAEDVLHAGTDRVVEVLVREDLKLFPPDRVDHDPRHRGRVYSVLL